MQQKQTRPNRTKNCFHAGFRLTWENQVHKLGTLNPLTQQQTKLLDGHTQWNLTRHSWNDKEMIWWKTMQQQSINRTILSQSINRKIIQPFLNQSINQSHKPIHQQSNNQTMNKRSIEYFSINQSINRTNQRPIKGQINYGLREKSFTAK